MPEALRQRPAIPPVRSALRRLLASTLIAAGALAMPDGLAAQQGGGLQTILMETEGKGPQERVTRFVVNPEARRPGIDRAIFHSDEMLQTLAEDQTEIEIGRIESRVREEQWQNFSNITGGAGAVIGVVSKFDALQTLDGLLTGLGVAVTAVQVYSDLAAGRPRHAAAAAFRGSTGFAIARYGSTALQLGALASFIVDYSLTSFATEAWRARTDGWRQAYTLYFTERGRRAEQWQPIIENIMRNAGSEGAFRTALDAELQAYASRPWNDPRFSEDIAIAAGEDGRVGFARGDQSLTEEIRSTLEDEHTVRLTAMLLRDVFPRATHQLWLEALEDLARRANRQIVPEANRPWGLQIDAPLIEEPTALTLQSGTEQSWRGMIEPGTPLRLRMTTLAFVRAGGLERVILHLPEGDIEQEITWDGRLGEAIFAAPEPEPLLVTAYRRQEGAASCEVEHSLPDGTTRHSTETRSAPAPDTVHFGPGADGRYLFGRFSIDGGWQPGAIGRPEGSGFLFGPPHFDNITALQDCSGGLLEGDFLADASCTLIREDIIHTAFKDHGDGASVVIGDATAEDIGIPAPRRCRAPVTLSLRGAYLPAMDGWQYHSLEGEAGRVLRDALRQGIMRGIVAP